MPGRKRIVRRVKYKKRPRQNAVAFSELDVFDAILLQFFVEEVLQPLPSLE